MTTMPCIAFHLTTHECTQATKVFQLQQNFASPTGNMTVKDESGRVVCLFKGKWVSVLDCVLIKDPTTKR